MYILRQVWENADQEDKFRLANLGQSPSYISLATALSYYELTTQLQQNFFESMALKRTKVIQLNGNAFRYTKIDSSLYFGFRKEKGFFMATPEKALLDAFYLMSYARYSLDLSALEKERFDRDIILSMSSEFPLKTREKLKRYGYLQV